MPESGIGGPDINLGGVLGPPDEQLVRIQTARVAHAAGEALVVTVAGEIDLFTIDRFHAAVAAGFQDLRNGEMLVIDLTQVLSLIHI